MALPVISHVGIVVADLQAAIERYSILLGHRPQTIKEVADMGVTVAVFEGAYPGGGHIELLAPDSPDNSIGRFLDKRGEGLHHICIHVPDIEAALDDFRRRGFRLIDETPRTGALGHKIAFLHPQTGHGVLIELEEKREV